MSQTAAYHLLPSISQTLVALACGVVFAAPAMAQTTTDQFDVDADGALSSGELRAAFGDAEAIGRFDVDGDQLLAPFELAEALHTTWDSDDDGALNVTEWDGGVDRWFGEAEVNLGIAEWDRDGDGLVSTFELTTALEETDLFAGLDADDDALLNEQELEDTAVAAAGPDEDGFFTDEDDGFLRDMAEAFLDPPEDDGPVEGEFGPADEDIAANSSEVPEEPAEEETPLIERGEPFVQLPVPCEDNCDATAARFCEALGFEPPLGTLAVEDQLYVVRCADDL